jgi:hypothetical protein
VAFGFAEKTLSTSRVAGKATNSKNLTAASTGIQALVATASFVSLVGKTSPTAVLPVVGATFAKKTALTFGLAGDDDKQARCIAAAADIVAAGLSTWGAAAAARAAAAAATGVGAGVGGALLVLGAAQLVVAGYQAHQACLAR